MRRTQFNLIFIAAVIALQFILPATAQARNNASETGGQEFLLEELDSGVMSEPHENNEPDFETPNASQAEINSSEAIIGQTMSTEIIVGTPAELKQALSGDVEVIRIVPENGGDSIVLAETLKIESDRDVALIADSPVKIVNTKKQWMITTKSGTEVSMRFANVALDGGGTGGGINNFGPLTLDGAVIQNFSHPNGGSGVHSEGNLTVTDCRFLNNYGDPANYCDGGAVYAGRQTPNVTVSISNSEFTGNSARYGGAVRIDNGSAEITNCVFSQNTAAQGAGIYLAGANTDVTGCTLKNNTGSGGAIFANVSSVDVTGSDISNNYGRGIYGYTDNGRDVEITVQSNSTVSGNYAKTSYGGGIIGYSYGNGKVTINIKDNVVISNNEAMYGGGVSGYTGSNVFINLSDGVRITGNKASEDGGGIWVAKLTDLKANNSVFENNSARTAHLWSLDNPSDDKQATAAVIHRKRIFNTTYTQPFTNAYNEYDVNYATAAVSPLYTVTYDGNGSSGGLPPKDNDSPHLAGEDAVIQLPGTLVKKGYRFTGWNTEQDGTGVVYAFDDESPLFYPQSFTVGSEDVLLYAQWEEAPGKRPHMDDTSDSGAEEGAEVVLTPPQEFTGASENLTEAIYTAPEIPEQEPQEPQEPQEEREETVAAETIPEYPPVYQLVQLNEDTVELIDDNEEPVGEWVDDEVGWTYYPEPEVAQPVPLEDGSVEIVEPDGMPSGLWSKAGNDEWAYEEYKPVHDARWWAALTGALIVLAGLLGWLYLVFIARRYVTREEFVRMLVKKLSLEAEIENTTPYTDVSEDAIYYGAVMSAKTLELLTGFPESEFEPEKAITREEIAGILARTALYANVPVPDVQLDLEALFKDFGRIDKLFLEDVRISVLLKIMQGRAGGVFSPGGLSSKRQAEKYIDNLLCLI